MTSSKQRIRIGLFVFFGVLIVGYILFQSKNLLLGPQITVTEPSDGATLTYNLVTIKGVATNISRISIDDRPIFVDDQGNFSEKLIAPHGYSIIKVEAQDKFGKATQKLIHVYLPDTVSVLESPVASSTMATSTATSS